jgi:hypothetical protein
VFLCCVPSCDSCRRATQINRRDSCSSGRSELRSNLTLRNGMRSEPLQVGGRLSTAERNSCFPFRQPGVVRAAKSLHVHF